MTTNPCCDLSAGGRTLAAVWNSTSRPFQLIAPILLIGLTGVLYAPVLARLAAAWWQDPNYSHGFLVPLFSGYVLMRERAALPRLAWRPSNLGLLVMLGAVALLVFGTLAAELYTSRVSLVLLLAGIVLFLAGRITLHFLALPLGYLLLAIPIPALVQNHVVLPLQLVASSLSAAVLQMLGVVVFREGNLLHLGNTTLEVAQACSGIRSLMSLVALAIAYGYLARSRPWLRIVLVVLMLPVAVISNALRVVGTGIASYAFSPELADGFFHTFSGLLIFLTALVMMLVCDWLLRRLAQGIHGRIHTN